MTAIYYIHGFGSSADSTTARALKEHFPDLKTPTYDSNTPALSVFGMMREIIKTSAGDDVIIIASSLGGWYANEIAKHIVCDLVLYNPSTRPWETLTRYGVKKDVLDEYRRSAKAEMEFIPHVRRHIVLSTDDEIIPCEIAAEHFKAKAAITYTDGGHRSTDKNINIIAEKVEYLINSF